MVINLKFLKKISFIIIGGLISQLTLAAASEDEYLKQLEMEAGSGADTVPAVLNPANDDSTSTEIPDDAPTSMFELISDKKKLIVDVSSFESALKKAYPESYALYEQLDEEQKKSIYMGFTQHKRLYNSSVKVISVYLGSN